METTQDAKVMRPLDVAGRRLYIVLTLAFFALTAAFYVRTSRVSLIGDASSYLSMGQEMQAQGVMQRYSLSSVRTIAYPAFISLALKNPLPLKLTTKIVVLQTLLYWATATLLLILSGHVLPDQRSRRLLALGLFLNPLAALYCAEILTEGLSLSALLGCATILLALDHYGQRQRIPLLFSLGMLAGVALIIRPANLALVAASLVAVATPSLLGGAALRRRAAAVVGGLLPVVVGIYVAISPQLASNWKHFNKMTPFPTMELGKFQIQSGILMLRYATFVNPVAQVRYDNPFAKAHPLKPTDGIDWYGNNPGAGLMSIAGHAFATVAQDPLYTYTTDMKPWYRIPVLALNAFAVIAGLAWLLGAFWKHRWLALQNPFACFLLAVVAATLTIGAFSAAESRFGLQVISIAFVGVCLAVGSGALHRRSRWLMAGVVGSPIFVFLALKLGDLAVLVPVRR